MPFSQLKRCLLASGEDEDNPLEMDVPSVVIIGSTDLYMSELMC
jgi:hypothetical protein